LKKIFFLLLTPVIGIAQIDTTAILKSNFIEDSFTNFDSLVITDCIVYNKEKSSFTGTVFFIDYLSRYYFIKEDSDKPKVVLKIMTFKDGLKSGISRIIDLINGEIIKEITFKETLPVSEEKKYLFKYADVREEESDLHTYITFTRPKLYTVGWEKLTDDYSKYLGDEQSVSVFLDDKYINKLLVVTTELSYGSTSEEYGHWASDTDNYLYRVPPNYCGNKVTITNIKIRP
jgi:hypothetical protein